MAEAERRSGEQLVLSPCSSTDITVPAAQEHVQVPVLALLSLKHLKQWSTLVYIRHSGTLNLSCPLGLQERNNHFLWAVFVDNSLGVILICDACLRLITKFCLNWECGYNLSFSSSKIFCLAEKQLDGLIAILINCLFRSWAYMTAKALKGSTR